MRNLLVTIWQSRDYPSILLLTGICAAALWCAALPISSAVQQAYLYRFHLRTNHFAGWAAQQLSPAMYNLENTYWFSECALTLDELESASDNYFRSLHATEPGATDQREGWIDLEQDLSDPKASDSARVYLDMVNHFPTRVMTFGQSRAFLASQQQGHFYFCSRYRGTELRSKFQVSAKVSANNPRRLSVDRGETDE